MASDLRFVIESRLMHRKHTKSLDSDHSILKKSSQQPLALLGSGKWESLRLKGFLWRIPLLVALALDKTLPLHLAVCLDRGHMAPASTSKDGGCQPACDWLHQNNLPFRRSIHARCASGLTWEWWGWIRHDEVCNLSSDSFYWSSWSAKENLKKQHTLQNPGKLWDPQQEKRENKNTKEKGKASEIATQIWNCGELEQKSLLKSLRVQITNGLDLKNHYVRENKTQHPS